MKSVFLTALGALLSLGSGCLSPNLGISASRSGILQPSHAEFATQGSFIIRGAASRPGTYTLQGRTTLTRAIAAAGGAAADASSEVEIIRASGNVKQSRHDLKQITAGHAKDPTVQNGDMILLLRKE